MLYVGIQDRKFDKVTFIPEISNKGWCQENNASCLILSISYNAAVFTVICSDSKFTSFSLPLLFVSEGIAYIAFNSFILLKTSPMS